LVPGELGSSFSFEVPASEPEICDLATSDESGNVAAGTTRSDYEQRFWGRYWYLFDSKGGYLNRIRAVELFPQGSGYVGLAPFELPPLGTTYLRVAYWTPAGEQTATVGVTSDLSGARGFRAPNGFLVVTYNCSYPSLPAPNIDPHGRFDLRRIDSSAQEKALIHLPVCEQLATAVVDDNQNWLLLAHGGASVGYAPSDLVAQGFDPTGKSLTGWFRVATLPGDPPSAARWPAHEYLLHALIGGGAALQIDGAWTFFFPSGKNEVQAAPEFLASHPNWDFTLVRGARAYALLPRVGDTTEMELFSASGNRCGSLKFPTGNLTTGADGSVISSSGARGCTKTVWPGLLR
jgi:hypothetical protein